MMMTQAGTLAYMDKRVTSGEPYDMSVDIYSLGMIFLYIYKGTGLFDNCKDKYELKRMRSYIDENYDSYMEEELTSIPPIMQKIIKNCLTVNHKERYTAPEISSLLETEIGNNKSILSKLLSTMDE